MNEKKRGAIAIYATPRDEEKVSVTIQDDTVWLNQAEIAKVFSVDRTVIGRHIRNIFNSAELDEKSNVQKMHIAKSDRPVSYYSLDTIISVGYRINSKKATQFRIWANKILKDYLVKGFVVNEKRLLEYQKQLTDAQNIIRMIAKKSHLELMSGHENQIIDLVNEYAKSWKVLQAFDENKLAIQRTNKQVKFEISYDGALIIIGEMKNRLQKLQVNVYMFGTEIGHKLASTLGTINQTFDGRDLYPSIEEKAANLLYLVIKDHPLADGNKRVASILFIYFLENNNFFYRESGERKISDNTLVALALLVATSDPKEKDNIIKLIINLIQN